MKSNLPTNSLLLNISMLLLSSFTMLLSCNTHSNKEDNTYRKRVKTTTVKEIPNKTTRHYPGIIEEAEEINMGFRVAGPIKKIHVKEGSYISQGELIAEMDNRDYIVQKNAIEVQVNQLRSEYKRIEELKKRNSVSDNDFEKMKAGKEMAETKLKNAQDQLNDTKLIAPFSGYITKVMFENGELVNQGTPVVSIVDVSMLKVEINVPVSTYIKKDRIEKIECSQDNIPNTVFDLQLYSNNIKANNNGLYSLYLYHKPKTNTKLAPGMNVQVTLTLTNTDSVLTSIPVSAIFENNNNSFVWVVTNGSVHSRKIETNNVIKNGHIGIKKGLQKGEQVVIGGLNLLSEGESVEITAPSSKSNIGNIL